MSGTDQTAAALLRAGKLDDAVAAAQAALRKAPTDLSARVLLGELLVFTGNLERADVVLDAASAIDPTDRGGGRGVPPADPRRHGAAAIVPRRQGAGIPRRSDRDAAAATRRAGRAARRRPGGGRAPGRGRRGRAAARGRAPRRCGVRRSARRGRSAGRQLRSADHDRQVFLDSHRTRADARIPRAEAPARPAVATRLDVGRRRTGRRGLHSRGLRRR